MEAGSRAGVLSIENNQLLNIAPNELQRDVTGIGLLSVEGAEVASNTIKGVVRAEKSASSCAGIRAMACRSLRITGNEVSDVGPVEGGSANIAAIDVVGSFDRLDVFDNAIRRHSQPVAESGGAWYALRIGGVRKPVSTFPGIRFVPAVAAPAEARTTVSPASATVGAPSRMRAPAAVTRSAERALASNVVWGLADLSGILIKLLPGREGMAIRGNLMQSQGFAPLVEIDIPSAGACLFSENRCFLDVPAPGPGVGLALGTRPTSGIARLLTPTRIPFIASVVTVEVRSAVVTSNYFQGPEGVKALQITVAKDGDTPRATVLGNISNEGILLNGDPLGGPWVPLNVTTA
jgi:hypothetical protein